MLLRDKWSKYLNEKKQDGENCEADAQQTAGHWSSTGSFLTLGPWNNVPAGPPSYIRPACRFVKQDFGNSVGIPYVSSFLAKERAVVIFEKW